MPPLSQRMLTQGNWQQIAALAGRYMTFSNPTPGTGLNTIEALTSLADTSPLVQINTGVNPFWVDYIKLQNTAAGTGGTSIRWSWSQYAVAKPAPTLNAAGVGGAASPLAMVNSRSDWSTYAPTTSVYAGPLVAAAGTPIGPLSSNLLRPVIPVAGDVYLFKFGEHEFSIPEALVLSGTNPTSLLLPAPQAIVGPNTTGQFHIWLPSQSAHSSWEIEIGGAEITD